MENNIMYYLSYEFIKDLLKVFVILLPLIYFLTRNKEIIIKTKRLWPLIIGIFIMLLGVSLDLTDEFSVLNGVFLIGADYIHHEALEDILGALGFVIFLVGVCIEIRCVRKEMVEKDNREWVLQKTNRAVSSLYQNLEKKNIELQKLDQLKSDFVSTVSHELRTPLAISMEGINLIVDGLTGDINEKQEKLLNTSKENLERLSRIINDLLDISKIESGKMELLQNLTDITHLIDETVDSFQRVVAVKKIDLRTDLPSESVYLCIDKNKIIQVIVNLLNNANKFTSEGGVIEVSLIVGEDDVIFSIKDSGKGIAKEDMNKLFKKFQQIAREDGAGIKGTGLGLTISKNIVELHKGRIWAESVVDEGTNFCFTLPTYQVVKLEFERYFDDVLMEAHSISKPTSFILTFLNNFHEIKSEHGDEAVIKIMNTILDTINRINSRVGDKSLLYDIHTVYTVLPDTDKSGGDAVVTRIKEALLKCQFGGKKNPIHVNLKFGLSVFPFEGKDRQELIGGALDHLTKEKNILVVDDHPQIFRILEHRMKGQNYHLKPAYDGEQALALIHEKKPDLIVLDIMMPKMNGYEMLGRLKENLDTASIPVIILTAKNIQDVQTEASGFGSMPILSKTGSFEKLIQIMKEMV